MKTHKLTARPRTADTSILTHDDVLTLTHLIEDAGYKHHCPPSLGLFHSMMVTILYLEENIRQQVLAMMFNVSQPTISRATSRILDTLDAILPPPPTPQECDRHRYYVLDGTLVECWGWKTYPKLYSGKHKKTGFNLQILTDQAGEIYYIYHPLPCEYP